MEEEQRRLALESAVGNLRNLEQSLAAATERRRAGGSLLAESVRSGQLPDRLAGIEETRAAQRHAVALAPRIADAQDKASALREGFLAKRVERRQTGTMIHEAEAHDAAEAGRRGQQALDEWYLHRLYRAQGRTRPSNPEAPRTREEESGGEAGKTS
ncbi:MAG: flagellar FliJ family protein [Acidobacteriota bacterium]